MWAKLKSNSSRRRLACGFDKPAPPTTPSSITASRKGGSLYCKARHRRCRRELVQLASPMQSFLKYVVQPGVLQDKPGPSIATEFGPLLPPSGGSGLGLSWTGIVSQRWEWGTVHLNMETNLTPDQHGELFFDAIIEGPNQWKVRPVFEIYSDSVVNQSQTFSALVGAIWQARDNLAFDVGLRYALESMAGR